MTCFNEWHLRRHQIRTEQADEPDPTRWRMILLTDITPTVGMSIAEIVSAEVLSEFGYERQTVTLAEGGSFVGNTYRSSNATVAAFVADGASISHDAAVVIADADDTAIGSLLVESVDATTNRLTITGHPFTNGDPVCVTSTVTLPGNIEAATKYFAKSISSSTIELYEDEALITLVDLSSTGSGDRHVRRCGGVLHSFVTYPTRTIGDQAQQQINYSQVFASV